MDMSVDLTLDGITPSQFIRWLEHYLVHMKPNASAYPIMPSQPGKRSLLFVDPPQISVADEDASLVITGRVLRDDEEMQSTAQEVVKVTAAPAKGGSTRVYAMGLLVAIDLYEDLLSQIAFEWPEAMSYLLSMHPGWLRVAYSSVQADIAAVVEALPSPYESSLIDWVAPNDPRPFGAFYTIWYPNPDRSLYPVAEVRVRRWRDDLTSVTTFFPTYHQAYLPTGPDLDTPERVAAAFHYFNSPVDEETVRLQEPIRQKVLEVIHQHKSVVQKPALDNAEARLEQPPTTVQPTKFVAPPDDKARVFFADYNRLTAQELADKLPDIHASFKREAAYKDLHWRPYYIAAKLGLTATTIGRYLNCFRDLGIREINGIPFPPDQRRKPRPPRT